MKTRKSIACILLTLSLGAGFASAAAPASAPATQPLSKTVGVDIVKLTTNPDKTITALFSWKAKSGDMVSREVIINKDTVISIGGKVSLMSDVNEDRIHRDKVVAMVGDDNKTAILLRFGKTLLSASKDDLTAAQSAALEAAAPKATAASDTALEKRVNGIVAQLNLNSPEREARVKAIITTDLKAVRDSHNAWMAPAKSVRENFNASLKTELLPEQIDKVKDIITSNDLRRHWDAYHIIVPGLTLEDDVKIMDILKQARESALDVKNVDELGSVFEPYKTQIEKYLISKGHDWKTLWRENGPKVGQAPAAAPAN